METTEVLKGVRDEIKAMDWEEIANDGHRLLVAKHEVLEIVQRWLELAYEAE